MAKSKRNIIQLSDSEAVAYIRDRAKKERRTFSNALAVAVLEAAKLDKNRSTFRDNLHVKGTISDDILQQ